MRRKGFLFDSACKNYVPVKASEIANTKTFSTQKRLSIILSLFAEDNPDPKKIAEITGFESHIELAEFMKSNDYAWNDRFGNYIKTHSKNNSVNSDPNDADQDITEIYMYLPLLRKLFDHKDKLYSLITSQNDHIAQFIALNDTTTNKDTYQLNNSFKTLINEFIKKHHLTLPELFELAITEYINKHN